MSKIYTNDEVRQGRVPRNLDVFQEFYEDTARVLESSEGIIGAILGGSVATNSHTLASDIDGLIIVDDHQLEAARKSTAAIYDRASWYHIPLDLIILRQSIAITPLHPVAPDYATALRQATTEVGCIKQDPLALLAPHHMSAHEDAVSYISRKLSKFERGLSGDTCTEASRFEFLEEILNTPIHVARRLLDVRDVRLVRGTAVEVQQAIAATNERVERRLATIMQLRQAYSQCLLSGKRAYNDSRYTAMLQGIEETGEEAYQFCYEAAKLLVYPI